jgi:hypothetical protein
VQGVTQTYRSLKFFLVYSIIMEDMQYFLQSIVEDFESMDLEDLKKVRFNLDKVAKDFRKKAVTELSKDRELWRARSASGQTDEDKANLRALMNKNPDGWSADKIAEVLRRVDILSSNILSKRIPPVKSKV